MLAEIFPPVRAARLLLREAGFPMTEMPGAPDTAVAFWEQVSESLAHGALPGGRGFIMAAAARRFPGQPAFASGRGTATAGGSTQTLRVLVVGASPSDTGRIRPDREAKAIEAAAAGGHLVVRYCPAAAATDLRRALDFRPDILHFVGHGRGAALVFENAVGQEHPVPARDMADTLRLYRDLGRVGLRGVVLGSCEGDLTAAEFTSVADRVVAHRGQLDDDCAVIFAGYLYEALAYTQDVGVAARLAARHTMLTDDTCGGSMASLLVLPDDG